MTIVSVLGTRPEIIKMAPLLPRFDALGRHLVVHSGQHYSAEMDAVFFGELELRVPDYALHVGSGAPAAQVARIAEGVEGIIEEVTPDWVVVHGDTNTTLGGALAAAKHRHEGIKLAHIEAGARSFNRSQPEELNRVLVDQMADLLCVPTDAEAGYLKAEGIREDRIVVTGNTIVDSCRRMARLLNGSVPEGLRPSQYAVATVHRAETVDSEASLRTVWEALSAVGQRIPVVLPLHPRTRKMVERFGLEAPPGALIVREPVGYREMSTLLTHARFCLTDSGGLQEEAAILGVPALVLRDETEHRRYVDCGLHRMTGRDSARIIGEAELLLGDEEWRRRRAAFPKLDQDVTTRIIDAIESYPV